MNIELKELKDYVSLTQGLAINEGSAHLVSSIKNDEFSLPLLRITDMMENKYEKYISNKVQRNVVANFSDIIYTRTGQIGLVFTGKYGVVHNNSFIVKIINNELLPEYLYAILQTNFVRNQAISFAHNSVQPDLTHDMFKSIKIPVPSKIEQLKFANVYSCLTAKIENNNTINNNLQQTINTIYEYWFYQFEFPNNENKPYKSNNGNLIWNKELKRNIPADWKVQNFYNNELYKLISSGIDKFKVKTYLATADVNGISINNGSIINFETRESRANMQPVLYSVWFAKMKNSVKHLFLNKEMNKIIDNYILSTGFYGFQCSENSFEYVSSIISSTHFENLKDLLSHGATQQGITDDDLKNIKLLVPNIDVLNKFHNATKGLYSQLSHNLVENKRLVELRNYLLPLLMNGQATIDK